MGDKKDSNDNWSGVPGFVQSNWDKQQRENRRVKKLKKLKGKATNKDGKGKR